ncbi:TetR family transcriptional regulator [Acrocarpospora catenulata]|uniref:TetR family transcriptional regulator n=1 Tax=Acrocarpospora catenulata TaxID=2836182 RepID=UPI001BDAD36B|nr:TetR family transcriptional regulator [Acrocarpospora catenulata]
MSGLRERKKEQTRRRIAEVALRLFVERGFDAVTVNEIAAAAEVAKVTLFKYFPTKESLVLEGVAGEDLAGIVAKRGAGESPLVALRGYFVASATRDEAGDWCAEVDDAGGEGQRQAREALVSRMRLIFESPALASAANELLYRQRQALAEVLVEEYGELAAALMAAQICASVLTVQEVFYRRLVAGASLAEAGQRLEDDVELAFDLLEHGMDRLDRPKGR